MALTNTLDNGLLVWLVWMSLSSDTPFNYTNRVLFEFIKEKYYLLYLFSIYINKKLGEIAKK